jgi:hypothetical protein
VVLVALPLHGPRAPAGSRFSGQLFASPDVVRLNEAMAQAAHDVIALLAWLRSRTTAPIGVLGIEPRRLRRRTPRGARAGPRVRDPGRCAGLLRRPGASLHASRHAGAALARAELRDAYRVHSPLAHAARVARERLLILAAHGDRIVPAEHPRWLEAHWNRPRTVWFSGSHLAPFGRPTIRARSVASWATSTYCPPSDGLSRRACAR